MKKFVCLFVCLFVCACVRYKEPLVIVNAYSRDFYSKNMCREHFSGKLKESVNPFSVVPFDYELLRFNKTSPDACSGYFNAEFYQSSDDTCFLIGYTTKDLFAQKIAAGYSPESKDAIFLLEPTGIRLVSRSEYEQIKPTLKPHPYDPSLCKPKPTDLK